MSSDDHALALALSEATREAAMSPCAKSKRGVVVFWGVGGTFTIEGIGHNAQPEPFSCDGSDACRAACGKLCVHAEMSALRDAGSRASGSALLHVKVVDGKAVPSGPPSCWQCSREILAAGCSTVWLLHEDGLQAYSAEEFHRMTLEHCGLPITYDDR